MKFLGLVFFISTISVTHAAIEKAYWDRKAVGDVKPRLTFFFSNRMIYILIATFVFADSKRCTTIAVTPGGMADGSAITTHNNDCQECDLRITHVYYSEMKSHLKSILLFYFYFFCPDKRCRRVIGLKVL